MVTVVDADEDDGDGSSSRRRPSTSRPSSWRKRLGSDDAGAAAGSPRPDPQAASLLMCLPDDVLRLISTHLSALDIARSASTCSRWRTVAADDAVLWLTLYYTDFDSSGSPVDAALLRTSPKRAYAKRLQQRRRRSAAAAERRRLAIERAAALRRQTRLGAGLNACQIVALLASPFLLLLVWLSLLFQRLDRGSADGAPWAVVFIPLYVAIGLVGSAVLLFTCVVAFPATSPTSVWSNQTLRLSWSPLAHVYGNVLRERRRAATHAAAVAALAALGVVTIVLKLEGVGGDAYNWGTALLPFWVAAGLQAFALCGGGWPATPNSVRSHVAVWACCLLPLLTTAIVLTVSLDNGNSIPLHWVFFPLWLLAGLLLVCLLGTMGTLTAHALRAGDDRPEMAASVVSFACFAAALFVPPVLFFCLLTARVEGALDSLSWLRVGGPLLFLALLGALVGCAWCVGIGWQVVVVPLWEGGGGEQPADEEGEGDVTTTAAAAEHQQQQQRDREQQMAMAMV